MPPAAASAFAAASLPLDAPVLQEAVIRLGGEVPVAPFAVTGTAEAGEVVSPFAGTHRAALLRNHGAVSWGPDLFEAWYRMETLEHWATVLLNLRALGRSGSMSPEQTEALKAMME